MNQDGTRVLFWLDVAILVAVFFMVIAGKWDLVIAFFIALVALNSFDRLRRSWRRRRR